MWVNHREAKPYIRAALGKLNLWGVGPNVSNTQNCHLYSLLQTKVPPTAFRALVWTIRSCAVPMADLFFSNWGFILVRHYVRMKVTLAGSSWCSCFFSLTKLN